MTQAKSWSASDPRLEVYLSGYLTVLISGMVEDCVEHLVRQRVAKTNDAELADFVTSLVARSFQTPNSDRIAELMRGFSESYRERYLDLVTISSREALGSIVANRMSLAHSGTWRSHTTIGDVEQYFQRIRPVLDAVEQVLSLNSSQLS